MNDDSKTRLLLEEFRQAWAHYRHLETSRTWAIGLLYSVVLAGVAGIWKLQNQASATDYFASFVLAFFVGLLALNVYVRTMRLQVVLNHYASVLREIRRKIYGSEFNNINKLLDAYENPAVKRFFSSVSQMSKWSILIVIFSVMVYLVFGAFACITAKIPGWLSHSISIGMLLFYVIITITIFIKSTKSQVAIHFPKETSSDE